MCICLAVVSTGKTIFVFACKVTNNYSINKISMHLFSSYFSMFFLFLYVFRHYPPHLHFLTIDMGGKCFARVRCCARVKCFARWRCKVLRTLKFIGARTFLNPSQPFSTFLTPSQPFSTFLNSSPLDPQGRLRSLRSKNLSAPPAVLKFL